MDISETASTHCYKITPEVTVMLAPLVPPKEILSTEKNSSGTILEQCLIIWFSFYINLYELTSDFNINFSCLPPPSSIPERTVSLELHVYIYFNKGSL